MRQYTTTNPPSARGDKKRKQGRPINNMMMGKEEGRDMKLYSSNANDVSVNAGNLDSASESFH